jgi:hypothetical protein
VNEAQLGRISVNAEPDLLATPVSQSAPATDLPPTPEAKTDPYPWILNPVVDLLFACGGIFWPIFLVMHFTGAKMDTTNNLNISMFFIGVIGLHLFSDGHQPATLWRVYLSKSTREVLWKPVTALAAAAVAVGAAIVAFPAFAVAGVKIIILASIQHQLMQSYGVALIYCYKRRYYMNKMERDIMYWMVQAAIAFIVATMLTNKEFGTASVKWLGMEIPYWQVLPQWLATVSLVVLQVMVLLFAGMIVRKYIKEKRIFPLPALMVVMTLIIMPFVAGGSAFTMLWLWVGSLWFHSCQYLVVTSSFYFKERGLPENVSLSQIGRMLMTWVSLRYFATVFFVGLALAFFVPMGLHQLFGVPQTVALAAVYVAMNMHHFITDGFIWKLRDPKVQKLLVA